jgi:hypothetical protein
LSNLVGLATKFDDSGVNKGDLAVPRNAERTVGLAVPPLATLDDVRGCGRVA